MSITSLPSNYGIGTLGIEAYRFIDFLHEARQTYWQILPIGPTSYGDSPYQTFSAFAGNPYLIDLDILVEENLLMLDDISKLDNPLKVNYQELFNYRIDLLKKSFNNFNLNNEEYFSFKSKNNFWLEGYSKFMSLKVLHNYESWNKWNELYKDYNNLGELDLKEVEFWCYVQYIFFKQFSKLKEYANSKNVKIIGDMAIYVAYDSSDVWQYPNNYQLDNNLEMKLVAGCPPDGLSDVGQIWGNPLYNWEYLQEKNFDFWVKRVKQSSELYDIVRIDHFRGFAGYYGIPINEETAINGTWFKGPGVELFNCIKQQLGEVNIIAEDLGLITPDVIQLLDDTKFPGMKLITFGFGTDMSNEHLPHNYNENIVCYAGTHDNSPINGWKKDIPNIELEIAYKYLNSNNEYLVWDMIESLFRSRARYVITTMQDLLELDETSRMNYPGKLGDNWIWRIEKTANLKHIIEKLKYLSFKYNRN